MHSLNQAPLTESPTSARAVLTEMLGGSRDRPAWFDESIDAVLDGAGVLLDARGPRELEDAAARLLGTEQHRRLHAQGSGLWFNWWFTDLADAAMARAGEATSGGNHDAWKRYAWLLHAMTGLGSPVLARTAHARLNKIVKTAPREVATVQPSWLRLLPKITATGRLWQMRDGYGGRSAIIAGFTYPGGVDPSAFLFDIDACGFIVLAGAGSYDNVEQAAAAWRASVGQPADGALPVAADTPQALHALVQWDDGEQSLNGDEPRPVLDNWFRSRRRLHELAEVLRRQRTPLPARQNLYRDVDAEPSVKAFTAWYTERYGSAPDRDAVAALAYEWLEGALPGSERVVSPARIAFIQSLMSDWIPDDPVTIGAKALLLDWVRWNAELTHLPAHLLAPVVAAATTGTAAKCGPDPAS